MTLKLHRFKPYPKVNFGRCTILEAGPRILHMDVLVAAIRGSDFVVEARQAGELVGWPVPFWMMQVVYPRYFGPRRGSRAWYRPCVGPNHFGAVYACSSEDTLTDDRPEQIRFYAARLRTRET